MYSPGTLLASSRDPSLDHNVITNLLDLAAALGNDQALARLLAPIVVSAQEKAAEAAISQAARRSRETG